MAAIYDADNPDGPDHTWFRAIASSLGAVRITDLGCGTGLLTVTLAEPGRRVVGIDPAPAMLGVARARPGGDCVEWRLGGAELIEPDQDLVIMSGNVAMHLLGDDWAHALACITGGLAPGGVLAFETRNPAARAWEHRTDAGSERQTSVGLLRESTEILPPWVWACVPCGPTGPALRSRARLTNASSSSRRPDCIGRHRGRPGRRRCHRPRSWSWLYHPYDGGTDVIADSLLRDSLTAEHRDRLPPRGDGSRQRMGEIE